jgi:coenzyme F420-reducing hydrogenase gamma subunit
MVFSVDVPLSKKKFVPHVTCNLRNLILVRVSESTSLISTKYFDSALSRDLTIPWDDRARVKITMDLDVLNQSLPRIGSGTGTWPSCGCDCPD